MSSMFKKKGGLAFKPKIPSARRPAAPSAPAQASKAAEKQTANDPVPDEAVQDASETTVHSLDADNEVLPTTAQAPSQPSQTPLAATSGPSIRSASEGAGTVNGEPRAASVSEGNTSASAAPEAATSAAAPGGPVPGREERTEHSNSVSDDAIPAETTPDLPLTSTEDSTPVPIADSEPPAPEPNVQAALRASTATQEPESTDDVGTQKGKKKLVQNGDGIKKPRPRKRKSSTQDGDESQTTRKRGRSLTPEDAESQLVDLQNLRMADLTKDLHIGKKFSRHDELRDRERVARVKAKLSKEDEQPAEEARESSGAPASEKQAPGQSSAPSSSAAAATAASGSGPQFRIVDGQIVVDQNSLVMDRHARAAAALAGEDMETIEENDFTRLITSSSFMTTSKLKGPNIWTDQETEMFYHGLRMFGTDFEIISKMFPGKQRRHIKLKFNREERHCPRRIDATLIGEKTTKMNIDEYKAVTGSEFESVESIMAEQRKVQEGYEAEAKRIVDEQAEIMRKKREQLFADDDGNEGGKRKKKGSKKKGKEAVSYGLNGEPISTS